MGVGTVGLGTGYHPEEEVIVLGFRNGEEGINQRSAGGGLVRLPCNGRVRVLDGGEYGEDNFPLRCLKVQVGGGVRRSKERGVPRDIGSFACR